MMLLQRKTTKMSVFARTLLPVNNALIKRPRPKISGKSKGETQRVSYKLTVFHLIQVWVECQLDNASFKKRPVRLVEKKTCVHIMT